MKKGFKIILLLFFIFLCLLCSDSTRADDLQSARSADKENVSIKLEVASLIKVSFLGDQLIVETNTPNIVIISSNEKTGQEKKSVLATDGLFSMPFQEETSYLVLPEV